MTLLHLDVASAAQSAEPKPVRTGVHRGAVLDRAQYGAALAVLRQRWREPARMEGSSP